MKKKKSSEANIYNPECGPVFGYNKELMCNEIFIRDKCNEANSCHIYIDGNEYDYLQQYRSSLFVNTAGPDEYNYFSVSDYEVFTIDYQSKYNIFHMCKYPDIIWEYIKTNDISEDSLKTVDNESVLINDLDVIHYTSKGIREKILMYIPNNPSEYLINSHLVNKDNDNYFREWLGNESKWELIYRASEHAYTGKSFHELCNDKGPTLIVIKSTGGCIFGGFTTQSWSGKGISFFDYFSYYQVIKKTIKRLFSH